MRLGILITIISICHIGCDSSESTAPESDGAVIDTMVDGTISDSTVTDSAIADAAVDSMVDAELDMAMENLCEIPCQRMTDCAAEVCEGDAPEVTDALCQAECASNLSFASVILGINSCYDMVAFARQTFDESFSEQCILDPAGVPTLPVCDLFGQRLTECVQRGCAPIEGVSETFRKAYIHLCNEQVALGNAGPDEVSFLANSVCEAPVWTELVTGQLEGMSDFCGGEASLSPEVCAAACEVVGPCIDVDDENAFLRNAARCEQLCLGFPTPGDAFWVCAQDAPTCGEVFACLQATSEPPPEVAGCDVFGMRLSDCLVESCASLGELRPRLDGYMQSICNSVVAEGQMTLELVASITPQTACDSPLLMPYIQYLSVVDPADEDTGLFASVCDGGLMNERAICEAGCQNLGPCLPENANTLRDPDRCVVICAVGDDPPAQAWQCYAEAEGCAGIEACGGE